ncbi:MAG: hypothetical protein ABEK75_02840, partial [Salinibacter sp.]
MSSATTDDLARQFIQAWHAGHRDVVDELAADTLTVSYTHFPEPLHGPEALTEMLPQPPGTVPTSPSRWMRWGRGATGPS